MSLDTRIPERSDIVVIGAGPAGMAAAAAAAEGGATVVLLDEQQAPGGQIYRAVGLVPESRATLLGEDYKAGRALVARLDAERVVHVKGATVWEVTTEGEIAFSVEGTARLMSAERIIVATGATERPMPFPGWTLPGVMPAGAGQILLKTAGLLPATPLVLAGSGPLLFLLAVQYLDAGQPIAAIVESTPAGNWRRAFPRSGRAARGWKLLAKGVELLWRLRWSGVPHYRGARGLRALGEEQVETVTFEVKGRRHSIDCRTLLIHNGVVPNVQISRSLGLQHDWDPLQLCWRPRVDDMGRSSEERILVAGDGAGIGGVEVAVPAGRLAAHAALESIGRAHPTASEAVDRERAARVVAEAPRAFLDVLYAPAEEFLSPPDETVVCRCEEVTAGQIRSFVDLGCLGPNQAKSFGRCGMGPCQGRYCGLTISSVIAAKRGVSMEAVGALRVRPPLKPVTIAELATLATPADG